MGRHASYGIANEMIDGSLTCVERIGPDDDDILHVSRNKLVGEGELNDAHKALLSKSITKFSERKAISSMTRAEVKRLLDGAPDTGVDVKRLIDCHERRAAIASV